MANPYLILRLNGGTLTNLFSQMLARSGVFLLRNFGFLYMNTQKVQMPKHGYKIQMRIQRKTFSQEQVYVGCLKQIAYTSEVEL